MAKKRQIIKQTKGTDSPIDPEAVLQAQDVMYDAWESASNSAALRLAKKALGISPHCSDAYNLLAELQADTIEEALELYRKGVEAGRKYLGEKVFEEDAGMFWGLLETRPFMRSMAGVAQCLNELSEYEEAIAVHQEMLRLNPNDNQGIRYGLLPCLMEAERFKEAESLYAKFKDDYSAFWLYSRPLLDFQKGGSIGNANASLTAAIEYNELVPPLLLGNRDMPDELPEYYSPREESEAVVYVHYFDVAWATIPGALDWLEEVFMNYGNRR